MADTGPSPLEIRVMRLERMVEEQAATIALLLPVAVKAAKKKKKKATAKVDAILYRTSGCSLGSGCYNRPQNQTTIEHMLCSGCGL